MQAGKECMLKYFSVRSSAQTQINKKITKIYLENICSLTLIEGGGIKSRNTSKVHIEISMASSTKGMNSMKLNLIRISGKNTW